jgi:hypothetical protein
MNYSALLRRAAQYVKENWGAPFIIACMICLIGSAAELGVGYSGPANEFATYGFYFLAVGVALQIGAYLKYGEAVRMTEVAPSRKPTRFSSRQKVLAVAATAIVLGGVVSAYYNLPAVVFTRVVTTTVTVWSTPSVTSTITLTAEAGPVDLAREPGGEVVVSIFVSSQGGELPYGFVARWGDGAVQNSTAGVFCRTFLNQTIPGFAEVTVTSADGQTASLWIEIPNT